MQRRIVYSTDGGRVEQPKQARRRAQKHGHKQLPALPQDGVVRIFRERGQRSGKTMTVVRGLPEAGAALEARAHELKRLCGAGGTVKDGAIEVQGDHRERIAEHLRAQGFQVKFAGG